MLLASPPLVVVEPTYLLLPVLNMSAEVAAPATIEVADAIFCTHFKEVVRVVQLTRLFCHLTEIS